jgi:hypothetical protein
MLPKKNSSNVTTNTPNATPISTASLPQITVTEPLLSEQTERIPYHNINSTSYEQLPSIHVDKNDLITNHHGLSKDSSSNHSSGNSSADFGHRTIYETCLNQENAMVYPKYDDSLEDFKFEQRIGNRSRFGFLLDDIVAGEAEQDSYRAGRLAYLNETTQSFPPRLNTTELNALSNALNDAGRPMHHHIANASSSSSPSAFHSNFDPFVQVGPSPMDQQWPFWPSFRSVEEPYNNALPLLSMSDGFIEQQNASLGNDLWGESHPSKPFLP